MIRHIVLFSAKDKAHVEQMLQAALLPQPHPRECGPWPVAEWWLDTLRRLQHLA